MAKKFKSHLLINSETYQVNQKNNIKLIKMMKDPRLLVQPSRPSLACTRPSELLPAQTSPTCFFANDDDH